MKVDKITNLVSWEVTITSDTNTMSQIIRFNATGTEQSWILKNWDFSSDVRYTVTANTTIQKDLFLGGILPVNTAHGDTVVLHTGIY